MRPLALVFVSLSLILCLISTTTNNWYERIEDNYNSGLFFKCLRLSSFICNRISYIHSRGLAISSLIFLIISILSLILSWYKSNSRLFAYLTALFLLTSSLLSLSSYIFYPRLRKDDCYKLAHSSFLMLISSLLAFLSTISIIFVAQTIY
jgi:hypothetical protein